MTPATSFASRSLALLLALPCSLTACMRDDADEEPPTLADAPELGEGDEIVFERQLRWWTAPTAQRLRLVAREGGGYLLLREGWQGFDVYAWAEGELTAAGVARLAAAEAAVDLEQITEPVPGDWDCTYVETLTATVHVGDQAIDYLSLCPPAGVAELAGLYEELSELLLDCPLDPSWYDGELPLTQSDCEQAPALSEG